MDEIRPPMMAQRQRSVGFAARLQLERHGQQANDGGQRSHQDGPQADAASVGHRFANAVSFAAQHVCEIHDQDAVGNHHALQHHDAHQRLNVQRGAGQSQRHQHADRVRSERPE